ncbi:hypothetical protein V6N13_030047 [Hibiscus sabdariffa]
MLDSEPPPLTTPFVSPTLNSPFLSLGLFWEALKGGNEQSCGQAGAPMTSVQVGIFSDLWLFLLKPAISGVASYWC